jgi:RHS repeat-associated protein
MVTDTKRYGAFGMLVASTGSNPTPFGFVGGSQYQTDADSGLMLLGHRYYDASIGRFISRDPAYAGTNWYAYCENNPLGGTDPEGLDVNDGSATNNSKLIQFVDVDFDPERWAVVPRTHRYPKGSAMPKYELIPRDGNGPIYPAWPADPKQRRPGQGDRLILPVAPSTTVGGNGVDVDAGWDPIKKSWIKTGGRGRIGIPTGNANWGKTGAFNPSIVLGPGGIWPGLGTGDPNLIIFPPTPGAGTVCWPIR